MSKDYQIFVLSFGRSKVPTLDLIKDKKSVIVLTSVDNKFKDKIDTQGAQLVLFDKNEYKGRGLEMMNEESIPHKRSAVYGYNYAIEWGRKNGVLYICVLDDDYKFTEEINDRHEMRERGGKPKLDNWVKHAVSFLKDHQRIAATCAINNGQMISFARSAYLANLEKRQLMNTIVFDTQKEHHFLSLGNGDYVTQAVTNSASRDLIVRLQTLTIGMETIKHKKHDTIDYRNLFYSRWSLKMIQPAYSDVRILKGENNCLGCRFNSVYFSNSAPKIISL